MNKKKEIVGSENEDENVENENVENFEEIEIKPKRIIRKTNRHLKLAEEAELGADNIEKIVNYKKKVSEKQAKGLEKARIANANKIKDTKKKLSNYDLLVKENELLKKELFNITFWD